jgi:hypothetical protein
MAARMRIRHLALLLPIVNVLLLASTPGVFRGTLIDPPVADEAGWIYVQARNGAVRRVNVSGAQIVYTKSVPEKKRSKRATDSLIAGAEVRVLAIQDESGEWRAPRVEILQATAPSGPFKSARR